MHQKYFAAKYPYGEIFLRRKFINVKISFEDISYGEISHGEISYGDHKTTLHDVNFSNM